jgi:hypothetical protein
LSATHHASEPAFSSSMERPTGAAPRQTPCNVPTPTVPSEFLIRTNGPLKIPDLFWRTTHEIRQNSRRLALLRTTTLLIYADEHESPRHTTHARRSCCTPGGTADVVRQEERLLNHREVARAPSTTADVTGCTAPTRNYTVPRPKLAHLPAQCSAGWWTAG